MKSDNIHAGSFLYICQNTCCNHDLVTKGTLHVQQTWYPGLLLLLDPPPLSLLNGSVCIASSSIKTFNATQQLGNGLLPL